MLRLQDAIILGNGLKQGSPNVWLSPDGSCGCALGGALLACGVDAGTFWGEIGMGDAREVVEAVSVRRLWPWLTAEHLISISDLYRQAYRGSKTIEDIAAYARSIEPQEETVSTASILDQVEEPVGV
jgi:hypothetical protein